MKIDPFGLGSLSFLFVLPGIKRSILKVMRKAIDEKSMSFMANNKIVTSCTEDSSFIDSLYNFGI